MRTNELLISAGASVAAGLIFVDRGDRVVQDCSSGKWRTVGSYPVLPGGSLGAIGPHRIPAAEGPQEHWLTGTSQVRLHASRGYCSLLCRVAGIVCRRRRLRRRAARPVRAERSGHAQVPGRSRRRPAVHQARAPSDSSRLTLVWITQWEGCRGFPPPFGKGRLCRCYPGRNCTR